MNRVIITEHANMQAVFKRNTVVTLYPIGGK